MSVNMNKTVALACAAAAVAASTAVAASLSPASEALEWLSVVDKGDYGQSWREAGDLFKAGVAENDWVRTIEPVRKPLGAVVSRKLASEQKTRSLPGAPEGDYDLVRFDTEFADKHAAVETVVLAHEAAGWKVDGYFIR